MSEDEWLKLFDRLALFAYNGGAGGGMWGAVDHDTQLELSGALPHRRSPTMFLQEKLQMLLVFPATHRSLCGVRAHRPAVGLYRPVSA